VNREKVAELVGKMLTGYWVHEDGYPLIEEQLMWLP
jgi:hypothetical protein